MESDLSVRAVHLVRAVLGHYVQKIDLLGSNICTLPLQLHFGCGDIDHRDVKHCTGVWLEERKKKESLLVTIIMSTLISKGLSRESLFHHQTLK